MSKVTRKRTLDLPFTESNMQDMLKLQATEIQSLTPTGWLQSHEDGYDGKCKGFYAVTSAEYPTAPFLAQMKAENTRNARAFIQDGSKIEDSAPFVKNVHLVQQEFDAKTLSAGIQVEKIKCVTFLAALAELVTQDSDGMGTLKYGGRNPLKGGFSSGPLFIVNQPDNEFRVLEQSNTVFSMRNDIINTFSKKCKEFKLLKADVLRELERIGYIVSGGTRLDEAEEDGTRKTKIRLQRMDLLLNWSRNSHYLMHQDSIDQHGLGYLTVIVNITPYKSTMLVAGAEQEVEFDSIGKGVAFPGCFWHRSGETRRGTIKLGFFFTQVDHRGLDRDKKLDNPDEAKPAEEAATSPRDSPPQA